MFDTFRRIGVLFVGILIASSTPGAIAPARAAANPNPSPAIPTISPALLSVKSAFSDVTVWSMREGADASRETGIAGARAVDIARQGAFTPKKNAPLLLSQVPVKPGVALDFALNPFDVLTPDARIVAIEDGKEIPLPAPTVQTYQGRSLDGSGFMFFAVDGDDIQAVISYKDETIRLMPVAPGARRYAIAPRTAFPTPDVGEFCAADYLPENRDYMANWKDPIASNRAEAFTPTVEIDLMIDIANSLYSGSFGSNTTNATRYATMLIGASSAIYQRDLSVKLRISTLTVWTTADPFGNGSSSSQLANYRSYVIANRSAVARDVAHLLGGTTGLGGIAYIDVLCNTTFGFGVSNIFGTSTFPREGYYWDVEVVSHELGHNFSSPHTHCFSPPLDMCYNAEAGCYNGAVILNGPGTIMSYCHLTAAGIDLHFHQQCVDLMRTAATAAPCRTVVPVVNRDTVGVFSAAAATYFVKNSHAGGNADLAFNFGPSGTSWVPISGDWDGNGVDSMGFYDRSNGAFFLKNSLSSGSADIIFFFGPAGQTWIPIVGDWNGDNVDSIALYNPANGAFFLKNSNQNGSADFTFFFGPGGQGWQPLAGDWDGDGIDSVGLYNPANGSFFFRNYHSSGNANITPFFFGPGGAGWQALVGDWDGDGIDTPALYNAPTGGFFLSNTFTGGTANNTFFFGAPNLVPMKGNWDGA